MKLGRIVSALLPLEYRAQVLGDLHERGFLPRDILSAIPAAWIAHLQREWIAPVPNMVGASDSAIRLRTEQLRRGWFVDVTLSMSLLWMMWARLTSPDFSGLVIMAPPFVLALLLRFLWDGPATSLSISLSRRQLVDDYRATLQRRVAGGLAFVALPGIVTRLLRRDTVSREWFLFFVAATAIGFAIMLYRWRRAQLELRNLQNPTALG